MKLTHTQRAAFFAGDWPVLTGKGRPPVEVGYVHRLSSRLSFEVTKIRLRPGGWSLGYTVVDDREQRFYLMPSGSSFPTDERGVMIADLPPEEEIGYTRNPKRARADDAPSVPPDVQTVVAMRSRLTHAQRTSHEETTKRDVRSLTAQIRETAIRMARSGVDPQQFLTEIQRQVNEHREDLDEAA